MKLEISKPETQTDRARADALAVVAEVERQPLVVTNSEQALVVGETVAALRDQKQELTALMRRATKPLNAALGEVRSWFRPALDAIDAAEKLLTEPLARYRLEQFKASEASQVKAAEAAEAGDVDGVLEALSAPALEAQDTATSTVFRWVVAHVDPAKLSRQYLVPDMRALNAYARAAGKGEIEPIPGVTFDRQAIVRRK